MILTIISMVFYKTSFLAIFVFFAYNKVNENYYIGKLFIATIQQRRILMCVIPYDS